jgi:hypothetical protein
LAQIAGVVLVLVSQLIAGARPTLPQMQTMPFPLPYIPYISYIRYGQEALYLMEVKWYKDIYNIESGMKLFGYQLSDMLWCVLMVPVFGILIRVLAYICLIGAMPGSLVNRVMSWIVDTTQHKKRLSTLFTSRKLQNDEKTALLESVNSPIPDSSTPVN